MKENKCAQEMVFDLVMRHGCSVTIRPYADTRRSVIVIVISHKENSASTAIDISALPNNFHEEVVCRAIEKAVADLFRHPYRQMIERHFHKEDSDNA